MNVDRRAESGRCCNEDYGGSHYHCGRCNKVSSMIGHFVILNRGTKFEREMAERHGLTLPFKGFTCDPTTNELMLQENGWWPNG